MADSRILVLLLCVLTGGCFGSGGRDGDGETGDDPPPDTFAPDVADTSPDPGPDTMPDTHPDTAAEPGEDTGPTDPCLAGATWECPPADLPPEVTCESVGGDCSCTLEGDIPRDMTLTPEVRWVVSGVVRFGLDASGMETGATLTILPGTTIYSHGGHFDELVISRGSRILAEGTPGCPIVFTSGEDPRNRRPEDWGGLVINGAARVNDCRPGDDPCEAYGLGSSGLFGGEDDGDDSGVISYVRVEFGGAWPAPGYALPAFILDGVGTGTRIDHVQVHMAGDDGVAIFGGAANLSHILVTGVRDDAFDWTDGWRGRAQHVVIQQWEYDGDNGIEADNSGEDNDAEPRSRPRISNVTLIGVPTSERSDLGILLREGTAGHIHCALVMGWNDACLDIDHEATYAHAWDAATGAPTGTLTLVHSIFSCAEPFNVDDDVAPFTLEEFFSIHNEGNEIVPVDSDILVDPWDVMDPVFTPVEGGPASSGCTVPDDPWFEDVDHIGGMAPGDDWTAGWTTRETS